MFGQNSNISFYQYGRSFASSLHLFDIESVISIPHLAPLPRIAVAFLPIVTLLLTPSRADKQCRLSMVNGSYGSNDWFNYEEIYRLFFITIYIQTLILNYSHYETRS